MAVRFDEKKNLFTLQTLDSTYQMKVDDTGFFFTLTMGRLRTKRIFPI